MFGFTYGVYVTTNILILRLLVDDLESALGLDLLSVSVASVIGPVSVGKNSRLKLGTVTWTSLGAVFDQFGNYAPGYYSLGAINFLSAAILLVIPLIGIYKERAQLNNKISHFVDFHIIKVLTSFGHPERGIQR